jgi:hypothetical protein
MFQLVAAIETAYEGGLLVAGSRLHPIALGLHRSCFRPAAAMQGRGSRGAWIRWPLGQVGVEVAQGRDGGAVALSEFGEGFIGADDHHPVGLERRLDPFTEQRLGEQADATGAVGPPNSVIEKSANWPRLGLGSEPGGGEFGQGSEPGRAGAGRQQR